MSQAKLLLQRTELPTPMSRPTLLLRGKRRHCYATSRGGFTLVEVLVATVVTLLMMVSLAQVFKLIGDSMKQGRAALELNSRLRNVGYRIQLDLNNCTASPRPGTDVAGYLKIYDGPLTDYSYGMISSTFNRMGDVDDIIMFTARAGDDWFVGKVPLFVVQGVNPGTSANDTDMVTITAQHAEIAIFAEPMVTNELNPERNPYYLRMNPSENYAKLVDPASGIATDLPSSYRLHYRTLLIRPDLNLPSSGALPFGTVGATGWLIAQSTGASFGAAPSITLPSPTCDMTGPHQQCDLSMRRVDPYSAISPVAANNLEDLANPANRFAHVQIPLVSGTDYSMPILALSPKLDTTYTLAEPGALISASSISPLEHQSGFIHPAFMLTDDRTGEDVLASDVLAFDVKGYDPTVPLYNVSGAVVSPNDPGYGTALSDSSNVAVGQGDFVDIGWGRKSQVHFQLPSYTIPIATRLISPLSGIAFNSGVPFTDSLYQSGLAVQSNAIPFPPAYSPNLLIFQPSYDTWYPKFEGDGNTQAEIGGVNFRGVLQLRGASIPKDSWRYVAGNYVPDTGTDGVDNTGSGAGIDDPTELETSAPFPMDLRGVKVTIRMEDTSARTFNQVTVTKEFVTQ